MQTARQNGGLCVSIIDNGSGMVPEVLAHLFEPFYTTKPAGEGSGLGLTLPGASCGSTAGGWKRSRHPTARSFRCGCRQDNALCVKL
ncbi:MAG: ATP-binding protein [Hymenobacter sp.]